MGVLEKLAQLYKDWGVRAITTEFNTSLYLIAPRLIAPEAGHSWPTNDYGNPCGTTESPFITNCNYDGAGATLQTIYGKLKPPVTPRSENV